MEGRTAETGAGVDDRIALITPAVFSAGKAVPARRHLVEHAPRAKMSLRASGGLPSSCSGAM